MSKPSRSKPNIPIHRESIFWILSPVSWILSPVFCLLPNTPILPNSPRNHGLYYAKQTQFSQSQNQHNLFFPKELQQYSAPLRPKKQTQSNPIQAQNSSPARP